MIKNKKEFKKLNSKRVQAKTSTALKCLLASLVIYNATVNTAGAQTTTTGAFTASTNVGSTCTFSIADTMSFGAYLNAQLTASAAITANCTNGTGATFYITSTTDGNTSGTYKLYKSNTSSAASTNWIEASFWKESGFTNQMTSGAATITYTGTGSSATAATIYGRAAASQGSDKAVGSFAKTLTVQISY